MNTKLMAWQFTLLYAAFMFSSLYITGLVGSDAFTLLTLPVFMGLSIAASVAIVNVLH